MPSHVSYEIQVPGFLYFPCWPRLIRHILRQMKERQEMLSVVLLGACDIIQANSHNQQDNQQESLF